MTFRHLVDHIPLIPGANVIWHGFLKKKTTARKKYNSFYCILSSEYFVWFEAPKKALDENILPSDVSSLDDIISMLRNEKGLVPKGFLSALELHKAGFAEETGEGFRFILTTQTPGQKLSVHKFNASTAECRSTFRLKMLECQQRHKEALEHYWSAEAIEKAMRKWSQESVVHWVGKVAVSGFTRVLCFRDNKLELWMPPNTYNFSGDLTSLEANGFKLRLILKLSELSDISSSEDRLHLTLSNPKRNYSLDAPQEKRGDAPFEALVRAAKQSKARGEIGSIFTEAELKDDGVMVHYDSLKTVKGRFDDVEKLTAQLLNFMLEKDKAKIGECKRLALRFAGQEDALFAVLRSRYGALEEEKSDSSIIENTSFDLKEHSRNINEGKSNSNGVADPPSSPVTFRRRWPRWKDKPQVKAARRATKTDRCSLPSPLPPKSHPIDKKPSERGTLIDSASFLCNSSGEAGRDNDENEACFCVQS